MVTKENQICFLKMHTTNEIIRHFMNASPMISVLWSDFFVPTKADILNMA